jgi:hypothetical protein
MLLYDTDDAFERVRALLHEQGMTDLNIITTAFERPNNEMNRWSDKEYMEQKGMALTIDAFANLHLCARCAHLSASMDSNFGALVYEAMAVLHNRASEVFVEPKYAPLGGLGLRWHFHPNNV